MRCAHFVTIWNELKEEIALKRVRIADDKKIAELLKRAQTSDDQRPPFRPDNRERRHEFSTHRLLIASTFVVADRRGWGIIGVGVRYLSRDVQEWRLNGLNSGHAIPNPIP
jgi:hypothetical protein